MSIETATYISDLQAANPTAGDQVSQGDDHLRLVKQTLQNTFPNANKKFYLPTTKTQQTADYTVVFPTDMESVVPISASGANRTVNLPTLTTSDQDGFAVTIVKTDYSPNTVTIDPPGSVTISGQLTYVLTAPFSMIKCVWSFALGAWLGFPSPVTPVGVMQSFSGTAAPTGWVLASGDTIGNASSAGTSRANADTEQLFTLLWNSFTNAVCPVTPSGRGASAAADFAANKKIALPDLRGRALFGKDDMGGTVASRLTTAGSGIDGTVPGASGGAQNVTLNRSDLPNVTLGTDDPGNHTHVDTKKQYTNGWSSGLNGGNGLKMLIDASNSDLAKADQTTPTTSSGAGGHTHTTDSINGNVVQTTINKMPPAFVSNWIIKL